MKNTCLTLLFGLAALLTGCGSPSVAIVLKGGESIPVQPVFADKDGSWETKAEETFIVERPDVYEVCSRTFYQLPQEEVRGLRLAFSAEEVALDRDGERSLATESFLSYHRFQLAFTNVSKDPIAIERLEALTIQPEYDGAPGKVLKAPGGDVYVLTLGRAQWFFVLEAAESKIELEDIPATAEKKASQKVHVWLPVNAEIAPRATWTYHAVLGCVRDLSEEGLQSALKLYRTREQPSGPDTP